MDLTDIYGVIHLAAAQYTFFSAAHGTFSENRSYFRTQSKSFNKHKKIEITRKPDCNVIILDLNRKRNYRKHSSTWKPDNTLLNVTRRSLKK
jgi:hypothetical protein